MPDSSVGSRYKGSSVVVTAARFLIHPDDAVGDGCFLAALKDGTPGARVCRVIEIVNLTGDAERALVRHSFFSTDETVEPGTVRIVLDPDPSPEPRQHAQDCEDYRLIHHAATGGDAACICSPMSPEPDDLVHLWRVCPDCGKQGAHHSYTDGAGESVGVRCG